MFIQETNWHSGHVMYIKFVCVCMCVNGRKMISREQNVRNFFNFSTFYTLYYFNFLTEEQQSDQN